MKQKAKRRSRRTSGISRARRADKYDLYQRSVQEPDADLHLVSRIFRSHYGQWPRLLREDFCGTAMMACRWVEWGRKHNLARLRADQAGRVKLIEGDVRSIGHQKVDLTVAFNFSYFIFVTRPELRQYFEKARATLKSQGLLVLDAYGGADAQRTGEEKRSLSGFKYVWDQHLFDPISHAGHNYIHFEFPDGSRLRRAFVYNWRLWTLPEIRELLIEAGFAKVEIYWEGTDSETGEGNSIFTRRERAPDDPAWVAYIAALP
jgi:hypothetical protein